MSPVQAFERALVLAVTAPSDRKAEQCVLIAEGIAQQLDEVTVQRVKRKVEEMGL